MKIILISIGSRGDMEPLLAIGEQLLEKGHKVICVFPEQFRNLAADSNLAFISLGARYLKLLDSDIGKAALGGGGSKLKKILAYLKLSKDSSNINKELIYKQYEIIEKENPDRIIYNAKCIYPIIWEMRHRGRSTLISPVPYLHYTKNRTHLVFNTNLGPFLNRLTYSLVDFGMTVIVRMSKKWLGINEKITRKNIRNTLKSKKTIYTISPALFSRPASWDAHVKVLGYQEKNKVARWQPDKKLENFLLKHKHILFVTFGSMTNPEPEKKTKIVTDILVRNKIPAIINTAAGGLTNTIDVNSDLLHFVSRIPYDWIFPKVYAVIHHGGSGTTHMSLKYGCASLIIPHIIDQYYWNKTNFSVGAGPMGIKIGKLTTSTLEPKLLELMENPTYKNNAKKISNKMKAENFKDQLYQSIIENNI